MSPAVLEARGTLLADEDRQSRLFEDLRRDPPAGCPPASDPDARPAPDGPAEVGGEPHPRSGGDRLTLEAHLARTWEGLLAAGAAECPVCGNRLEWRETGGACRECGSALR